MIILVSHLHLLPISPYAQYISLIVYIIEKGNEEVKITSEMRF